MNSKGKHVDLSQFPANNFNIGLTDQGLISIRIKELNKLIKNRGLTEEEAAILRLKRRLLKNREHANRQRDNEKEDFEVTTSEKNHLEENIEVLKAKIKENERKRSELVKSLKFRERWALRNGIEVPDEIKKNMKDLSSDFWQPWN